MNEEDVLNEIKRQKRKEKIMRYLLIFSLITIAVMAFLIFSGFPKQGNDYKADYNITISNNHTITIGESIKIVVSAPKGDNLTVYAFSGSYNESIGKCTSDGKCVLTFKPKKALLYTIVAKDSKKSAYSYVDVKPIIPNIAPPSNI